MSTYTIKAPTKNKTPIIKLAEEIANNANKPMSIDQIRAKFDVPFPFKVRKVAMGGRHAEVKSPWPIGMVVGITGVYKKAPGYDTDVLDSKIQYWTDAEAEQWVLI